MYPRSLLEIIQEESIFATATHLNSGHFYGPQTGSQYSTRTHTHSILHSSSVHKGFKLLFSFTYMQEMINQLELYRHQSS